MRSFDDIYQRAVERHGDEALVARFPQPKSAAALAATPDDRALAAITQRVFAAGFRWKVIQIKWDGFEEAFAGFDPAHVAALDAEAIDALAQDTRIVRNRSKIVSTVNNAKYVRKIADEHGSFGKWLAEWPTNDIIGLWDAMKAGGDRLGGDTGAWILRLLGKDTFRLSGDVSKALVEAGVVPKAPTGKGARKLVQAAFNAWAEESGLSLGAMSVVLACSTGEVYEH